MIKQPLLPLKATRITGKRSVGTNYAMAWNNDADWISAIR
jgi:hypothetical protein